ncbi:hypothetical protein ACIQFZ_43340 [Streptomyces sp. NPDC093064]|uniref:hypothetical protein n=1 Tax=Streptomyces sp. NPDC093064 TaxID=3366020 RepID=UPI0037FC3241
MTNGLAGQEAYGPLQGPSAVSSPPHASRPLVCAAIVDRVTFNAHIIETGTYSFRLAQTEEKRRRRA